jgi:hypothetical protein
VNQQFFFFFSTRVWTQGVHLEPLHQPYFCDGFFRDKVSCIIFWDWLQTTVLLIFASLVARITGMSHWHPVSQQFFKLWGNVVYLFHRILQLQNCKFIHWALNICQVLWQVLGNQLCGNVHGPSCTARSGLTTQALAAASWMSASSFVRQTSWAGSSLISHHPLKFPLFLG